MNKSDIEKILFKYGYQLNDTSPVGVQTWTKKGYWWRLNSKLLLGYKPIEHGPFEYKDMSESMIKTLIERFEKLES
jgi:hypothetical protein